MPLMNALAGASQTKQSILVPIQTLLITMPDLSSMFSLSINGLRNDSAVAGFVSP